MFRESIGGTAGRAVLRETAEKALASNGERRVAILAAAMGQALLAEMDEEEEQLLSLEALGGGAGGDLTMWGLSA